MAKESLASQRERMTEVVSRLKSAYPDAHCSLTFETPFQLLIATILSAQCTDDRVNQVTPVLFEKYPDAQALSRATLVQIESIIQSTGFYRAKAKSLKETSEALVALYGGEVPRDLEKLTKLRGVGRKTANVVLGNAYGIPGMVVDTHVGRITRRLGFTGNEDPVKVESDLCKIVQTSDWVLYSHLLISHGRAICSARTAPACARCVLADLCPKRGVHAKKRAL